MGRCQWRIQIIVDSRNIRGVKKKPGRRLIAEHGSAIL
jgi:hypothetical protein